MGGNTVFEGRAFRVISGEIVLPNGRRAYREFVVHPGAVVIIPFLDDETLVLIRQYRPAIDEWIYEFPAGTLEEGEHPRDTAFRELEEETGYRPGRLKEIGMFFTSPGISTEKMHVFVAGDLKPGDRRPEDDELIQVMKVDFNKLLAMVGSGEIKDGKTIAALMLFLASKRTPSSNNM